MFVGEKEASVVSNNWVIVFGSFPFLFPFLSSSFFPSRFLPPCGPVKVREMLEAGLSHDVSREGFDWCFLPSWDCWGPWQL